VTFVIRSLDVPEAKAIGKTSCSARSTSTAAFVSKRSFIFPLNSRARWPAEDAIPR